MKNIMHANKATAEENRRYFINGGITAINVMASPGAGKTSVILDIIERIRNNTNVYVVEGDIASSIDAEKIDRLGVPVIQINTGGGCHLDANMIKSVVQDLTIKNNSVLFIENVGNLVCPSDFDLGEDIKMVISSVPEGHDKPYKYTSMFQTADIIVLNKTDLLPYVDFDLDYYEKGIRALNSKAPILRVSCRTGAGLESLTEWLREVCARNPEGVSRCPGHSLT